jgi:hypothetical protein
LEYPDSFLVLWLGFLEYKQVRITSWKPPIEDQQTFPSSVLTSIKG